MEESKEMKYEEPKWEIVRFEICDVITQSQLDGESSGSGGSYGGNGEYPWE